LQTPTEKDKGGLIMESISFLRTQRIQIIILTAILLFVWQQCPAAVTFIVPNTGLQDTDGNFVYLNQGIGAEFCSPPGAVLRAPVTGGSTAETLYDDCEFSPFYVRVDGPQVYILDWNEEDVLRLPVTGGVPIKIADSQGSIFNRGFDTDADFVYWTDNFGVKKAFKTGIGTTVLATIGGSGNGLDGLVVDDTHVYYLESHFSGTYWVKRVSKSGGTIETLYQSSDDTRWNVREIHVDDNHLYWLESISNDPDIMIKMPKDGSTSPITFINPGTTRTINTLELRSNLVIFTESAHPLSVVETTGKIRYKEKTGGSVTDLVTGLTNPFRLVTDNRYVYWSDDNGRVGGTSGTKRENLPPLDNDGDGFDQTVDCDDNNPLVTTGNTCVSDNPVTVESEGGDVTVTFPEVTGGGTTTVTVEECTPPIEGITLAPTSPLCADITTNAEFEGTAKVCIRYDDTGLTLIQEANLSMVRCDDTGDCELLACSPPEPVDTVNNIVCGCTDGFSLFALGIPIDTDGDFTPDLLDNCPVTANVFQEDTDGDGVGDSCDNCQGIHNTDQRDTDEDGYGNLCDGDLNNDGNTNTLDLNLYKVAHRSSAGDPEYDPDADFNGDGEINTLDLNIYRDLHRKPPGPSCCGLF
jgi:hypothetical protein